MTNKNKNVLLGGIVGVLIVGALMYFVFIRKKCKSSADCLKHGYGLICKSGKCVPLGPDKFGSTHNCTYNQDCGFDGYCQNGRCTHL